MASQWIIYEVKNGVEDKWMTCESLEQAESWIKNYNENQRSTRQRQFVIKEVA